LESTWIIIELTVSNRDPVLALGESGERNLDGENTILGEGGVGELTGPRR